MIFIFKTITDAVVLTSELLLVNGNCKFLSENPLTHNTQHCGHISHLCEVTSDAEHPYKGKTFNPEI